MISHEDKWDLATEEGEYDNAETEESKHSASLGQRESAATALLKLARSQTELFHFGEDCFATISVANHQETFALQSRGFRRWLSKIHFDQDERVANGDALKNAIATLEGLARFQSKERSVFIRLADHDGKFYLDLCNDQWQVVQIGRNGWHVLESRDCPVRFRRAPGMQSLPLPEQGGEFRELRGFINTGTDGDFYLVAGWLIAALRPHGPYPILIVHGEQGSAKSTVTRVLRKLVDPNLALLRTEPREPRDLMIAANNGWVCAFDNLSHLWNWLSDCLCRLSTGGGFATRMLYTDAEETIFDAQRPVILNGIEEFATRGDLLSRALTLYLPRIRPERRRSEDDFWRAFQVAQPRLLGALLDVVSGALANLGAVEIKDLPRMADFAKWVVSAEPSCGCLPTCPALWTSFKLHWSDSFWSNPLSHL